MAGRPRTMWRVSRSPACARVVQRGLAVPGPSHAERWRSPVPVAGSIVHGRLSARGLCSSGRSGGGDEAPSYAEDVQRRQIKPASFYEEHAEQREYFYHIDLLGRLFQEDVLPKNVATSLKSPKFLNFFWRMLRPNPSHSPEFRANDDSARFDADYPFVSPCGKEMNYIRPADTPIVFDSLREKKDGHEELVYAETLSEPFDPSLLVWGEATDRLYHPVRRHKRLSVPGSSAVTDAVDRLDDDVVEAVVAAAAPLGLVRSHLAVRLAEHFTVSDAGAISLEWGGQSHVVRRL